MNLRFLLFSSLFFLPLHSDTVLESVSVVHLLDQETLVYMCIGLSSFLFIFFFFKKKRKKRKTT